MDFVEHRWVAAHPGTVQLLEEALQTKEQQSQKLQDEYDSEQRHSNSLRKMFLEEKAQSDLKQLQQISRS